MSIFEGVTGISRGKSSSIKGSIICLWHKTAEGKKEVFVAQESSFLTNKLNNPHTFTDEQKNDIRAEFEVEEKDCPIAALRSRVLEWQEIEIDCSKIEGPEVADHLDVIDRVYRERATTLRRLLGFKCKVGAIKTEIISNDDGKVVKIKSITVFRHVPTMEKYRRMGFVKGHIELEDEMDTLATCLREVREEVSIDLPKERVIPFGKTTKDKYAMFHAELNTAQRRQCLEDIETQMKGELFDAAFVEPGMVDMDKINANTKQCLQAFMKL